MQDISSLILKYKGPHPYLKILKKKISSGEGLTPTQITMATKMLVSVATLTKDKSFLPSGDIKDLNVDWDRYIERKPFNHQKIGTNWLLNKNKGILADDMGLGKRIADDIPTLTPEGWTPHGSLKQNDYVIGSNGKKTKVLATYPSSFDEYYTIVFSDGTQVESCENHLWSVYSPLANKNSSYLNLTVKQMLNEHLEIERKDICSNKIKTFYKNKDNSCKWFIPMVDVVDFKQQKVDLDPYLLGCMLGRDSLDVNIANLDKKIKEEIDNRFFENCKLSNFSFSGFIPEEYIFNAPEVRLEVLQGLFDINASCSQSGIIEFISSSKKLSDNIVELVQSFGGTVKIVPGKEKSFLLKVNFPPHVIPFKVQKKIDTFLKEKKKYPFRGIKEIKYSRAAKGQCIKVEAEDSLYVINNYTVTHNTQTVTMAIIENNEKTIIVCPKTLRLNWKVELSIFIDSSKISIIEKKWINNDIIIVNYDIIHKYFQNIIKSKFKLIVADEAHYVKNGTKSRRGKTFGKIANKIPKTWLVTGTPMANRPMDYYNLLKICKHPLGKNKQEFGRRYCGGKLTDFGWDFSGASNLKDLHYRTNDIMLRRLTKEVIDLPEKIRIPTYLNFTSAQEKAYVKFVNAKFQEIYDNVKNPASEHYQKNLFQGEGFIELAAKRMFCALEKLKDGSLKEVLKNCTEQGHKVVIFTNFTAVIDYIKDLYGHKCVVLDGRVKEKQRQVNIEKFQKENFIEIMACNYMVGAEGTTFTAADVTVANDLPFSPHLVLQGEKRTHRIGQKNKVKILFPIYKGTKEEEIFDVIRAKMENITIAIDNIEGVEFETETETNIIKKLINP
jgi:hypothetical protein